MARIIIASVSEIGRTRLCQLLASSGLSVYRSCSGSGELRRTLSECDDGIVIFLGTLAGCKPETLLWDYPGRFQILFIASPSALDSCEVPEVFRLSLPAAPQTILGAVQMLTQLHRMQLPKRTDAQKVTVVQPKPILQKQLGLSEPEAHRYLQVYAMNHGVRMAEYAARIVSTSKGTEE